MSRVAPVSDRRQGIRGGLRVVHRHRAGTSVTERTSELVYVRGGPVAVLDWIDLGGVRTPLYLCRLDPTKLRPDSNERRIFYYDDLTTDPRFLSAD